MAGNAAPAPLDPGAAPFGPAAATPVQPAATTPAQRTGAAMPNRPGRWRIAAFAAAGVVLAVVVTILLVLQWSGRAVSADGTFSVQVPSGWDRFTGTSLPDGTTTKDDLMVLLGPITDGIQAHVFIYQRQGGFVDLGQAERTWATDQWTCYPSGAVGFFTPQFSGGASHFSPLTPITIGGSAALVTQCRTSKFSVEFVTVNHGNRTYMIGFSAESTQFDQLRDASLQRLFDSWGWN